jgi:hypothetical protein
MTTSMDFHGRGTAGMTEREHHAWGALLKYIEAFATAYRYDRYPRNSKTVKKFERLLIAVRQLREQLNHEYGWVAAERLLPKSDQERQAYSGARREELQRAWLDVYYGDEVRDLHQLVFMLEEAPTGLARKLFPPDPSERELFKDAIENLVGAARGQTQQLPWEAPPALSLALPALPMPVALSKADRHADLRAALLENPDQPQAAFVKRFRVHPLTVRRCRRELEETGAIPFLAHRHGPAQTRRRRAELAEAAD